MDVLQFPFGWRHGVQEQREGPASCLQSLLTCFQSILKQHFRAWPACTGIQLRRVYRHRSLDLLEQVLVINDVAEGFVLSVEAIRATYGLEESMVLHRLINVEVRAARRIEAGEKLLNDDQEP